MANAMAWNWRGLREDQVVSIRRTEFHMQNMPDTGGIVHRHYVGHLVLLDGDVLVRNSCPVTEIRSFIDLGKREAWGAALAASLIKNGASAFAHPDLLALFFYQQTNP